MRIKAFVQRHAVFSYFVLAFAISWSGIVYVVGGPQGIPGESDQVGRLLPWVFLAMLAGPTIASLLVTAVVDGRAGLRDLSARQWRWRVHLRWYGVALLTAPLLLLLILSALATWVSPVFTPGILATPDKLSLLLYALVGGLGTGFFEELGWTGFATPKMRLIQRGLWATLGLGVLWMTWHLLADYWGSREYGSVYGLHVLFWYLASSPIACS
jgi:membrane protease YdiL (CAAX protease family)